MKKKLEAELISIAHRILKLKNKSELVQLHQEAQKIYEKLSVLLFVEENFADVKPTIGKSEAYEILETAFDEPETVASETKAEEIKPQAESQTTTETQPEVSAAGEVRSEKEDTSGPLAAAETPETTSETTTDTASESGPEETPEAETAEEPVAAEKEDVTAEPEAETETEEAPQETTEDKSSEKSEEKGIPEITAESVPEAGISFAEPETSAEIEKVISEPAEDLFKPAFEWTFEAKQEPKSPIIEAVKSGQIAFEDLLGSGYVDPVFVKPEDLATEKAAKAEEEKALDFTRSASVFENKIPDFRRENTEISDKTVTLNDRLSKGITVGLNDRIAFVKNLFGNSNEDYNRVLSQLITYDTFAEAQDFIDNMVKPDYNNWDGKDEYAARFMEVVEKKFS